VSMLVSIRYSLFAFPFGYFAIHTFSIGPQKLTRQ
jgi:hypothetical protein